MILVMVTVGAAVDDRVNHTRAAKAGRRASVNFDMGSLLVSVNEQSELY